MPDPLLPVEADPEVEKRKQEQEAAAQEKLDAQQEAQEAQQKAESEAQKASEKAEADQRKATEEQAAHEESIHGAKIDVAKALSDCYYKVDSAMSKVKNGLVILKEVKTLRDQIFLLKDQAERLCQPEAVPGVVSGDEPIPEQTPIQASRHRQGTSRRISRLLLPKI